MLAIDLILAIICCCLLVGVWYSFDLIHNLRSEYLDDLRALGPGWNPDNFREMMLHTCPGRDFIGRTIGRGTCDRCLYNFFKSELTSAINNGKKYRPDEMDARSKKIWNQVRRDMK